MPADAGEQRGLTARLELSVRQIQVTGAGVEAAASLFI
jgi:hypothetical protein